MQGYEVNDRIMVLCQARSWTLYRLAKESGITYSTLCTLLHKSNTPSIPTLMKIGNGLGITISEFFDEQYDGIYLTESQREHLHVWDTLTEENQQAAQKYIEYLLSEQNLP